MTENTPGSVHRRTVVAGAAWTVPVVATAIGAPLAAASGDGEPTLAFTNGPYTVAACGTLTDVVIKATTDGTAAAPAGTPVTVTLPDGLTWPGGGNEPRNLPVVANGEVVLSGLKATALGGDVILMAATTTSSTSTSVTVTPNGVAKYRGPLGTTTIPNVPAGSTVHGPHAFLAPNGDLYFNGSFIASGVTSADSIYNTNNNSGYVYYMENGVAKYRGPLGTITLPNVPAGSTVHGPAAFLAPNGDLYQGNTFVASGVTSADSIYNTNNDQSYVYYVEGTPCS